VSKNIKIAFLSFLIAIDPLFGIIKVNFISEDGQSIKLEKVKNQDGDTNMFMVSMFTLVLSRKIKEMGTE